MTNTERSVGKQINLLKGHHLFEVFIQFLSSGIGDGVSFCKAGVQPEPFVRISAFPDKTQSLIGMPWAAALQLALDREGGSSLNCNQWIPQILPAAGWPCAHQSNILWFKAAIISLLRCCWCLLQGADVGFTQVLPLFSSTPVREGF